MSAHSPEPARIIQLDALRGAAVIGIVWMNVYAFALPIQGYYNPQSWAPGIGEASPLDRFIWAASFVFIEDKFRTLFAMLFGAGCLMLFDKGGANPWRAHFARMAVLFAIGIAHSILLASNDILRAYAMAGLAVPFLAGLSHRALYAIAIGFVGVHVGGGIVLFGSAIMDYYAGRQGTAAALFVERQFGFDAPAIRHSLEIGREAFGEHVVRRVGDIPSQLRVVAGSLPLNLAAITLGMALWKDRMLAREWRIFRMQRLAAICAIVALPALLALAWWASAEGFPGALMGAVPLIFSAPFDTLLGLSYAALAMAFFTSRGRITQMLAKVGRLSLTNYLFASLILASIFAPWGLGLFGEVTRVQALGLSFVPIIAMVIWSPFWLAHFGQGPFERLWRKLASLLA